MAVFVTGKRTRRDGGANRDANMPEDCWSAEQQNALLKIGEDREETGFRYYQSFVEKAGRESRLKKGKNDQGGSGGKTRQGQVEEAKSK